MDIFNKLGEWALIAAGIAGGFVGARIHPEATRGPLNFVLFVVVGFFFAIFGAPAAADLLGVKGDRVIAGMGFFAAMLWMPIASRAREVIETLNIPFFKGGKS